MGRHKGSPSGLPIPARGGTGLLGDATQPQLSKNEE
jgi:hypothetical protein